MRLGFWRFERRHIESKKALLFVKRSKNF